MPSAYQLSASGNAFFEGKHDNLTIITRAFFLSGHTGTVIWKVVQFLLRVRSRCLVFLNFENKEHFHNLSGH
jgi:hypothetical protein